MEDTTRVPERGAKARGPVLTLVSDVYARPCTLVTGISAAFALSSVDGSIFSGSSPRSEY